MRIYSSFCFARITEQQQTKLYNGGEYVSRIKHLQWVGEYVIDLAGNFSILVLLWV